jgi:tetratricopeptide (TPR) repeat protein
MISSNSNNNNSNISCSVITDEVCTWRIWVKMADILLSQGLYQSAIEYLNEAKHISKAYGDTDTLANILLCETKLALFERKYQAAIDILMESNSLPCTYDTWCKIIDCYTTAVTNSDQLMMLLTEALATVKIVLANKPHHLLLITTILTLKMSVVDGTSSDDDNIEKNIQLLCDNGYTTIAVEILTSLAQRCNGMTHNDIITSIKWCRMAISILRERYEHVVSASQPNTQVMVLPIQRLLVKCHLVLVKYLLEVLRKNHDVNETHKKLKQDKRSIEKLIDDYLQEPSSSDPDEQQWNDLSNVAGDEGLSLINSCYGLCGNDSHLQTKVLITVQYNCHSLSLVVYIIIIIIV